MRGYFGLGQLSATEKQNILDQHKSLYNGYQTMQPQVSNTQPLHVYDFAGDKDGMVVNNKGEVKKYTNMGINEQVEKTEVCDECGAMRMSEGICEQCGSGKMEEATGKLDDIYDEEDLNPSAGFDYIEGPSNSIDTFEKMHKNLYKEDEYEDPDNEDDGFEDLEVGDQLDEDITDDMPYEKGSRGMKASRARASFIPTPQENEILSNLFGQYGEDIPPIVIRYLRKLPRKTLLNRLVRVGLIDKDLLKGKETIDEQGYTGGGNAPDMDLSNIEPAYDFVSDGPMAGGDVYPTEGEMEEQMSPEDMMRYKRRGVTYGNLLTFIEYEKDQFDACQDFGDEFEYADNVITTALDTFFIETEQELHSDFYFEVHDLCKDWFGEDLITEYMEECGGQEEEEEEDFMFMESAFADKIDEVDVSGSQGIYGEMDPPYDFDSEGPGKAGPYQRTSYNEEEMEVEDEEEFEIDEDLQESFHNQKNKIVEMMSRMKVIK
jgi:ribosomal protein L32